MNASEVIDLAGGTTATARLCNVKPPSVHEWRKRGLIPPERCPDIAEAAGKTCEEIRPDLDWVRDESGQITGYTVPVQKAA